MGIKYINMIDKSAILVSGGMMVREQSGKEKWFMIKQSEDSDWEWPTVVVKKGESSVRAILRVIEEKGGMTARVLEEAGRFGGVVTSGGETLPQRHLFYLILLKAKSPEAIGFSESAWFEFQTASKKTSSKREKQVFKQAKEAYKKWKKERAIRRKKAAESLE